MVAASEGLGSFAPPDDSSARDGALAPEGVAGRAIALTQRYGAARAHAAGVPSRGVAGYDRDLETLLDAAVPLFSDWCAIDIVDGDGRLRRTHIRHRGCHESPSAERFLQCCAPSLLDRVPMLDEITERVAANSQGEVWPPEGEPDRPWCVVVPLRVNNLALGTVTFAAEPGRPGYGPRDVTAVEEVATNTAAAMERVLLHRDARDAIRRSQRVASQLHQLIAVSITVAGLRSEQEILLSLAHSTRSVFDADVVVVALEAGSVAPLSVVARRGQTAGVHSLIADPALLGLPRSRDVATAPWHENDWLAVPVLQRRDLARGIVAIRRDAVVEFGAEDKEVLTLLAQVAARALDAVEFSRTIRNSEARWRVLVETAPVGLVEVDSEGVIQWWNRAASRIFAWSEYAPTPDTVRPNFPEPAIGRFEGLRVATLDGTVARSHDFIEVEIGGRRRDLTASAALLPTGDRGATSVLMLVDDVTDQRELKAELRHAHRMEIRGQVASSVAHDFNNLLTLISGYAEILTQGVSSESREFQMVKDIQATAYRASMLTRQLQTIGRTKATEPVVLDPTTIIESNAEVLERIVGLDVELNWSLQIHSRNVRIDADQFEQMILNLTLNARDAMPDGGQLVIATALVTLAADDAVPLGVRSGDFVLLSVADTGIGMDEETRRRCFEPLFTTKGPFKGTGLGLAAARRLVEESGGAIRCRSQAGAGTTFEIYLPVIDEVATEEWAPLDDVRPRGSATILVAEDDEGLRRLMGQVLRRNGYLVVEAGSGERALALVREFAGPIDALLSDVVMGSISGPELARTLQTENPALRVLLVSGTADAAVLEQLLPGTSAFLKKPFKPSELVDQVHELMSRRS